MTVWWLCDDRLMTVWWQSDDRLMTVWWPSDDRLMTVSDDRLKQLGWKNITDTAILTGYGVNTPAQGFGVTGGSKRQQLMILQQQRRLALLRQLNKFSIFWPTSKKTFHKNIWNTFKMHWMKNNRGGKSNVQILRGENVSTRFSSWVTDE